ncbi:MAG: DUF2723 domain-containing protein [candidate division Zixibacteria bacterium]|nr:DUF2723 domain-containing protein [candidate division Zixibacteria bacterium]
MINKSKNNLIKFALGFSIGITFYLFLSTAFRTIAWWDINEYSLAAYCLGIPHPPGSQLLVFLGWLVSFVPTGLSAVFQLNLFASLIAVSAILFVSKSAIKIFNNQSDEKNYKTDIALSLVAGFLTVALSETIWQYAVQFTPYILTALFTSLIIYFAVKWSEDISNIKYIFIIALLLGLDFSVHRTNILLVPGLAVWFIIFNKKIFLNKNFWMVSIGGGLLGLFFHLIIIPIAKLDPFLNMNNPSSFTSFWDYVTLKMYGGGMLINLYPRKAPFWDYQVMDYFRFFGHNFLSPQTLYLPAIVGALGLGAMFAQKKKMAIGLLSLFILNVIIAIIYFNIPQNFFRDFARHYIPSFIIFGLFIIYGCMFLLRSVTEIKSKSSQMFVKILVILILILMPVMQIVRNYKSIDGSKTYFAYDYASNLLSYLEKDAILFSFGDNDTFPLWNLQKIEKMREDVAVVNYSLLNTKWYLNQIIQRDASFPMGLNSEEINDLQFSPWSDTTISMFYGNDTLSFLVKPNVADKYLMISEQVMLSIIRENNWKRPIYIVGEPPGYAMSWVSPFLRKDGVVSKLMPTENPELDIELLKNNTLNNYKYRGYNNPDIKVEQQDIWTLNNYYTSFLSIIQHEYQNGNIESALEIYNNLNKILPDTVIKPSENILKIKIELKNRLFEKNDLEK